MVRLSLLTMTNPNQLCDVLLFVCSKMADETNLTLSCLLQIEQERSGEESSVGDALALAFCCARFCSALLILFASYLPAPLFMRPRHFVRSCAICSHDSVGKLKSLREALRAKLSVNQCAIAKAVTQGAMNQANCCCHEQRPNCHLHITLAITVLTC